MYSRGYLIIVSLEFNYSPFYYKYFWYLLKISNYLIYYVIAINSIVVGTL